MPTGGDSRGDTIILVASAGATQLTVDEFRKLPDNGMWQELVEGELIETPPPDYSHSNVIYALQRSLDQWATQSGGAFKARSETAFTLSEDPPTVRVPDVALFRAERVLGLRGGYVPGSPELAIEVVSPSNTAADLSCKIRQYLQFGSTAVLAVYPRTQEAQLFVQGQPTAEFHADDTITVPEAAPGWSIKVSDLF